MKKMLIVLVCFMASYSSASEVQSLSQGSCWVSNKGEYVQVASFNEGTSYSLYRSRLEELVNFLHDKGVSPTEIEGIEPYFHCSGMGGRIVFRVKTEKAQLCTWSQFNGKQFLFKDLDLADGEEGICDGVVANRLMVAPAEGNTIEGIVDELEEQGVVVTTTEVLFRDIYSITFENKGVEVFKVRSLLQSNKSARIVDLVTRQHPVGDSVFLESLSFKK